MSLPVLKQALENASLFVESHKQARDFVEQHLASIVDNILSMECPAEDSEEYQDIKLCLQYSVTIITIYFVLGLERDETLLVMGIIQSLFVRQNKYYNSVPGLKTWFILVNSFQNVKGFDEVAKLLDACDCETLLDIGAFQLLDSLFDVMHVLASKSPRILDPTMAGKGISFVESLEIVTGLLESDVQSASVRDFASKRLYCLSAVASTYLLQLRLTRLGNELLKLFDRIEKLLSAEEPNTIELDMGLDSLALLLHQLDGMLGNKEGGLLNRARFGTLHVVGMEGYEFSTNVEQQMQTSAALLKSIYNKTTTLSVILEVLEEDVNREGFLCIFKRLGNLVGNNETEVESISQYDKFFRDYVASPLIKSPRSDLKTFGWHLTSELVVRAVKYQSPAKLVKVANASSVFVNGTYKLVPDHFLPVSDLSPVRTSSYEKKDARSSTKLVIFEVSSTAGRGIWLLGSTNSDGSLTSLYAAEVDKDSHCRSQPPGENWRSLDREKGRPPSMSCEGRVALTPAPAKALECELAQWVMDNAVIETFFANVRENRVVLSFSNNRLTLPISYV